jgi:hypothetical protein
LSNRDLSLGLRKFDLKQFSVQPCEHIALGHLIANPYWYVLRHTAHTRCNSAFSSCYDFTKDRDRLCHRAFGDERSRHSGRAPLG